MKKIKFCVDQAVYKNIPGHRYIKINGWILSSEEDTIQVFFRVERKTDPS